MGIFNVVENESWIYLSYHTLLRVFICNMYHFERKKKKQKAKKQRWTNLELCLELLGLRNQEGSASGGELEIVLKPL